MQPNPDPLIHRQRKANERISQALGTTCRTLVQENRVRLYAVLKGGPRPRHYVLQGFDLRADLSQEGRLAPPWRVPGVHTGRVFLLGTSAQRVRDSVWSADFLPEMSRA